MKHSQEDIYVILGLGAGAHHMDMEELRVMWETHAEAVTRYWLRNFNQLPSCTRIAEREGWRVPVIKTKP